MENNVIFDQRNEGLSAFYTKIYALMGLGIATSAVVSFIVIRFFAANLLALLSGAGFGVLLIWFAPMLLLFPLRSAAQKNSSLALPLFFLIAAILGFTLSFALLMYTMQDITVAFAVSSAMFFGLSIYGRTTKRDLSGLGKALMGILIGLIVASVVNFFIGSSFMMYLISYIGVALFAVFIAYDNQAIKRVYESSNGQVSDGWAVLMAMNLYLDFINLFLFLLQIFGGGSRR